MRKKYSNPHNMNFYYFLLVLAAICLFIAIVEGAP